MANIGDYVQLQLFWGGNIVHNTDGVEYDRNPRAFDFLSRHSTMEEMCCKIFQLVGIDRNQQAVHIYTPYRFLDGIGAVRSRVVEVSSDQDLRFFLNPLLGLHSVELYLEFEPVVNREWRDCGDEGNIQMQGAMISSHEYDQSEDETGSTGLRPQNESDPDDVATDPEYPNYRGNTFANDYAPDTAPSDYDGCAEESGDDDTVANVRETLTDNYTSRRQTPLLEGHNAYSSTKFLQNLPERKFVADSFENPMSLPRLRYEKDVGVLMLGMAFDDKRQLQAAVEDWSVRIAKREFKVVESTPKIWRVKCKHFGQNQCRWALRAIVKKNNNYWTIRRIEGPHQCIVDELSLDHANLHKNTIAQLLLGMVRRNPTYDIGYVQQHVKDQYGFEISYAKAWYSLRRAIEMVYGTWEESVKKLPAYMNALQKYIPGTIVEWIHQEHGVQPMYTLRYVFWAFGPCINGYRHCRPVISVDGTHLYGKYKHKLLIAVALDADHRVLPLAFAIVDEESIDSWTWFLQLLSRYIVQDRQHTCLISDRHVGILTAVQTVAAFHTPRGVHRFCLRDLVSNFNKKFKDQRLKDLCWKAGSTYDVHTMRSTIAEIHLINQEASNWLERLDMSCWTMVGDGGWRHGIETTSMLECINGMLKGARRLPLCAIVQLTYDRAIAEFVKRFRKAVDMKNFGNDWAPWPKQRYKKAEMLSTRHTVQLVNEHTLTARVHTIAHLGVRSTIHLVSIRDRTCSCGLWEKDGVPCSHAIQVCRQWRVNAKELIRPYYSIDKWILTYHDQFGAVPDDIYWDPSPFVLRHDSGRRAIKKRGS